MKQSFSVSAIARQTGLDRRSIERALDEFHVPVADWATTGGRRSALYDRDEACAAMAKQGLPKEKIARLAPFGASVSRMVGWNVLAAYVPCFMVGMSFERAHWVKEFGITDNQAVRIAARTALQASMLADALLSEFGERCPETAAVDGSIIPFSIDGVDAAKGAFMALPINNKRVQALFRAAVKAMAA